MLGKTETKVERVRVCVGMRRYFVSCSTSCDRSSENRARKNSFPFFVEQISLSSSFERKFLPNNSFGQRNFGATFFIASKQQDPRSLHYIFALFLFRLRLLFLRPLDPVSRPVKEVESERDVRERAVFRDPAIHFKRELSR